MNELCMCETTTVYRLEADYGASPIWCADCSCNIEIEAIPMDKQLKQLLTEWASEYGEWFDWANDKLIAGAAEREAAHNKQGERPIIRRRN